MLVLCLLVLISLGRASGDDSDDCDNPTGGEPEGPGAVGGGGGGEPEEDETKTTTLGLYPYLALVWFADTVYCAGTVLSDRWVLTMAQCCIDPGVSCLGFVMTGGNEYKKDFAFDQISATTYKVMSAIRYIMSICCNREPMLLKTYNVIAFFEYVKPLAIVDEIRMPVNGSMKQCTLIGWKGTGNDSDSGFAKSSRTFTVKSMGNLTKDLQWKNPANCVFSRSTDGRICQGQLGGPLVVNGTLAGVGAGRVNVTRAIGMAGECGDPHEIYVYLYTGYYARWIKWHVNDVMTQRNFLGVDLDATASHKPQHAILSICFAALICFYKMPVCLVV